MSLLRFRDLKARSIVTNHVTLKRWIDGRGFLPDACLAPTRGPGVSPRSMRG